MNYRMHTIETKNQFIALRAAGKSYRDISEELQVDKSTLLLWNRQFGAHIENLRRIELEHLQQQLLGSETQRFKALASDYLRYHRELESRKPQNIPQYMLFASFAACGINSNGASLHRSFFRARCPCWLSGGQAMNTCAPIKSVQNPTTFTNANPLTLLNA
jgi:hypothetical protein